MIERSFKSAVAPAEVFVRLKSMIDLADTETDALLSKDIFPVIRPPLVIESWPPEQNRDAVSNAPAGNEDFAEIFDHDIVRRAAAGNEDFAEVFDHSVVRRPAAENEHAAA